MAICYETITQVFVYYVSACLVYICAIHYHGKHFSTNCGAILCTGRFHTRYWIDRDFQITQVIYDSLTTKIASRLLPQIPGHETTTIAAIDTMCGSETKLFVHCSYN